MAKKMNWAKVHKENLMHRYGADFYPADWQPPEGKQRSVHRSSPYYGEGLLPKSSPKGRKDQHRVGCPFCHAKVGLDHLEEHLLRVHHQTLPLPAPRTGEPCLDQALPPVEMRGTSGETATKPTVQATTKGSKVHPVFWLLLPFLLFRLVLWVARFLGFRQAKKS